MCTIYKKKFMQSKLAVCTDKSQNDPTAPLKSNIFASKKYLCLYGRNAQQIMTLKFEPALFVGNLMWE